MRDNSMSTASFVMGIISLILSILLGGGMLFGMLGIVFALLSRGAYKMDKKARTGLILSLIGTLLSLIITIVLLVTAVQSMDSIEDYIEEIEEYMYDDTYNFYDDFEYNENDGFENFFNYNFNYPENFNFDQNTEIHKGGSRL